MKVLLALSFVLVLSCKTQDHQSQTLEDYTSFASMAGVGETCGGVAVTLCKQGLDCLMYSRTPDAVGLCYDPDGQPGSEGGTCAGIVGTRCQDNLQCKIPPSAEEVSDASGVCVKNEPSASQFIALGDVGRAGEFNNIVTIYVADKDSQPRCIGCRTFRVIFDGYKQHEPIGGTRVSKVAVDTKKSCGPNAPDSKLIDLAALFRHQWSSAQAQLTAEVNPNLCQDEISIRFFAQKCLNPSQPECLKMEVKESYEVSIKSISELQPISETAMPNRRSVEPITPPSIPSQNIQGAPGSMCGGIAGLPCLEGFECLMYQRHPDASGLCYNPEAELGSEGGQCGGIVGTKCQDEMTCKMPPGTKGLKDATGVCVAL